jgi:hypothetical protein
MYAKLNDAAKWLLKAGEADMADHLRMLAYGLTDHEVSWQQYREFCDLTQWELVMAAAETTDRRKVQAMMNAYAVVQETRAQRRRRLGE